MQLKNLIKDLVIDEIVGEISYIEIERLIYDSRQIKAGDLFFCLIGENTDGHDYIDNAVENGASAVICSKKLKCNIPQIIVENTRKAFAKVCGNLYRNPAKEMKLIAVVGTNGKTTTTFLIKSILENAGKSVGLIGTQGAYIGQQYIETNFTTPDPQILHKVLRDMADNLVEYVVMEVSAHSIELDKIEGIIFDTAVFTNFTQDHLDYFKTMENYKKAKMKFFNRHYIKTAVLNFDDNVGIELADNIDVPFFSYGLNCPSDIFAVNVVKKHTSSEYVVNLLDNIFNVKSNLLGDFNIYNSLAAVGATSILGIATRNIKHGLENLQSVPGRFNALKLSNGATAIVDFAHTPDGIEKVLKAIKDLKFNRVITVFGCGGNRDKGKRPQMGKIAEQFSDFVIVTSDNPRFENPELIMDDIESGMAANTHICIVDRKEAIHFAMALAREGDVIAICGKGAEEYQDINGVKSPYNDFDVVIERNEEMQIEKMVKRG